MGSGSSKKNIPDKFDDKSQLHQQQTMGKSNFIFKKKAPFF